MCFSEPEMFPVNKSSGRAEDKCEVYFLLDLEAEGFEIEVVGDGLGCLRSVRAGASVKQRFSRTLHFAAPCVEA